MVLFEEYEQELRDHVLGIEDGAVLHTWEQRPANFLRDRPNYQPINCSDYGRRLLLEEISSGRRWHVRGRWHLCWDNEENRTLSVAGLVRIKEQYINDAQMPKVVLESPYRGDVRGNIKYAKKLLFDSLRRNEAPFLSHLLYPRVLDDDDPHARELGMRAGWQWLEQAEACFVGLDRGISDGMRAGIRRAKRSDIPVFRRNLVDYAETGDCDHRSAVALRSDR